MSFQQQKQLADQKDINKKLFEIRSQVIDNKKKAVLQTLKNDAIHFLKSLDFSVSAMPEMHTISANYKGQMNVNLTFSKPEETFFGADIVVDVDYLKQTFILGVNLTSQSFEHIWDNNLEKAITQYTEQNRLLETLNASDIDGSYQIHLKQENAQFIYFATINDALKHILQIEN